MFNIHVLLPKSCGKYELALKKLILESRILVLIISSKTKPEPSCVDFVGDQFQIFGFLKLLDSESVLLPYKG